MAARTASKDANAQSKRRLMSQKSSEEDEDNQESEEAEEVSPSNSERQPLTCLEHKAVSIVLQKSIVPWLIAMLGIDYPSNTTADLVRQMVAAISAHCMTPLLMSIPKQPMQLQR